jgi:CHAD domain-containing protein
MRNASHLHGQFRKRVDAFARDLADLEQGDVEALHRTRVTSRRLRELLPLLQLDHDLARKLTRRLRKVTRRLGSVRELDVLLLLIQSLAKDGRYSPAALKWLGPIAAQARMSARERMSAKLPLDRLQRLAGRLDRVAESLESDDLRPDRPARAVAGGHTRAPLWAIEARVARRAASLRAAIASAGAVYASEQLHIVRIALKKLRYSVELASDGRSKSAMADLAALKGAQDLLGQLHDLEMLLASVRTAQASLPASDLSAWRQFNALVRAVEDDCRQLHAHYMRDRVRLVAIADRMAALKRDSRPAGRRAAG